MNMTTTKSKKKKPTLKDLAKLTHQNYATTLYSVTCRVCNRVASLYSDGTTQGDKDRQERLKWLAVHTCWEKDEGVK